MKNNHKTKKKRQYKTNLRRHNWIVTRQTEGHLLEICAYKGWPEKDMGRAVDFVTREYRMLIRNETGHFYRCPDCGYRVEVTDRYCRDCGNKLNWQRSF